MNRFCSSLFVALTALIISAAEGVSQTTNTSTVTGSSTMNKVLGTNHSASRQENVLTDKLTPGMVTSVSDSSWDWTKDVLQTLYKIGSRGIDSLNVQLPWFAVGTKTYRALGNYPNSQVDFYRQEGWVLLYKNLGTDSTSITNPVFILYNKYRGILRFFFWNSFNGVQTYDYLMMDLTVFGGSSTPLFTFYPGIPQFSDQYPTNYSYSPTVYSFANIEQTGWCYADFNLTGFDDQLSSKYCNLAFEIWGLQGSLSISDSVPLYQVLSGNGNITETALNLQISGDAPVRNAFKEIRGLDGLRQELANINDSISGRWIDAPLERLAKAASTTSASWLGEISSLAGAVDGFIGIVTGGNGANGVSAAMPFVFNGSSALSGSFTPLALGFLGFSLSGSEANAGPGTQYWQSPYKNPLGIFNVITEPTVDYCYKVSSYQANSGTRGSYIYGTPYFALDKPVQIVYNPFDGLTLASATASLVTPSGGPVTAYSDLNAFSSYTFKYPRPVQLSNSTSGNLANRLGNTLEGPQDAFPNEMALNLKFTYFDSLTNEVDTVLFLKTYPVNLKYDPSIINRTLGAIANSDSTMSPQGERILPSSFVVGNYPNPFNPTTNVEYQLDKSSMVTIVVYNILGQKVAVLQDGIEPAGVHEAIFNGSGFASGVYFLRFNAQPQDGSKPIVQTDKMLLLK